MLRIKFKSSSGKEIYYTKDVDIKEIGIEVVKSGTFYDNSSLFNFKVLYKENILFEAFDVRLEYINYDYQGRKYDLDSNEIGINSNPDPEHTPEETDALLKKRRFFTSWFH